MPLNNYIAQRDDDARLQRQDLASAVRGVVSSAMSSVTVRTATGEGSAIVNNGVSFLTAGDVLQGGIRYRDLGSGNYVLEYYQGGNWYTLGSESFVWAQGNAYAEGDVVVYTGSSASKGWYQARTAIAANSLFTAGDWRLLSLGSAILYADSDVTFAEAVAYDGGTVTIILQGTIGLAGDPALTLTAAAGTTSIVIYSDEATSICRPLNFVTASGANIYWHANGTKLVGVTSLGVTNGTLWIERISTGTTTTNLTGDVRYQRIDGLHSGGTNDIWIDYQGVPSVPRDLQSTATSGFTPSALAGSGMVYVDLNSSGGYSISNTGYATLDTLTEYIAPHAVSYFKIDSQGPLTNRPVAGEQNPIPNGYIYNATDDQSSGGGLYIYQPSVYGSTDSGWSPAIWIRGPVGPQGSQGSQGLPGPANTLAVGRVATVDPSSSARVTITGTAPNQTISFDIPRGSQGASGAPCSLTAGPTVTLPPESAATVVITGTAPNQTATFSIPRGSTGSNGYTAVPSLVSAGASAGLLTWSSYQLSTPPTLPQPMNIIGPQGLQGKSMYDVWLDAGNTGTETDFLDDLGVGDRFMPFADSEVDANYVATFTTDFPMLSIVSYAGVSYDIPDGSVTYTPLTKNSRQAHVDLTWLYQRLDLVPRPARLTVAPTGLGTFSYVGTSGTYAGYYAWMNEDGAYLYTDVQTPTALTTVAYAMPGDVGSWSGTVQTYSPAVSSRGQLTGTWYAAFGGGGGNASFVNAVEAASGTSYTIYPGKVVSWTLSNNSTLSAFALDRGAYGTAIMYITTTTATLSEGTNMVFADQIAQGTNKCLVSWYMGEATLTVLETTL